jgi:hypothetical protein
MAGRLDKPRALLFVPLNPLRSLARAGDDSIGRSAGSDVARCDRTEMLERSHLSHNPGRPGSRLSGPASARPQNGQRMLANAFGGRRRLTEIDAI